MIKQVAREVAFRVAPEWAARVKLVREARWLHREWEGCRDIEEILDVARSQIAFRVNQRRGEILRLLQMLQELRPRTLCEIGAAGGGTLSLFCQAAAPEARVISIDIDYSPRSRRVYPLLGKPGQQIRCLQADSHAMETLEKVRGWLGGSELDFLFIDGDHTLAGVAADFRMYAPLVRDGGLIGFHDIVPDHRRRYGIPTEADAGEVPLFWDRLKQQEFDFEELIEDPGQDGYGIGVVRWVRQGSESRYKELSRWENEVQTIAR
jgi:cephalosporin hydroxylase